MAGYIIKRLLLMIPILLLTIFIVFSILSSTPGDPARIILGNDASEESVEQLRESMGLNRPLIVRYLSYIKDIVLHFDFGSSYRTMRPVFSSILPPFPTTLVLAIFSVIVSAVIGIPLGILSAVRQYSLTDTVCTVGALLLASVPGFWLALLLMLIFSVMLGLLPSSGIGSWESFVMPVATLALPGAAMLLRITRAQMLEVWRQDYIRTARAKGAARSRIIWKHAVKNALMPVVTVLGMSFASLLGGTVIVESVFGVPGLGNLIITSIRTKDVPVVMAGTIFLAALFMVIMLCVDLVYAVIDPRTRAQYQTKRRQAGR